MKPSDFFTRPKANEGSKMTLVDPATGKPSKESLTVLGFDSDQFAAALVDKRRENTRILTLPKEEQSQASEVAEIALIAACVTGWSMSEPFTPEAVLELIREAPSVRMEIDKFASNRANFTTPR